MAGSPGPLEKNTPSGLTAYTSSTVAVAGSTCTSMPRSAIRCGVMPLMPRSMAATVNFFVADRRDDVRLLGGDLGGEVAPFISGAWPHLGEQRAPRRASASPEKMPTRMAPRSRRWRVRARVSMPLMPTTPCCDQLVVERAPGAPVGGHARGVAYDVAGDPDPLGLGVLVVDAGVADVRGGHHDDLAVVRRVGEGLLVAGHAGGEHGLAEGLPHGPVGAAAEDPAVLQDEYGGSLWRLPGWRSSSCAFRFRLC